ncbi:MAG TPA: response regulator [Polyangiaceae bacterium]|jgi:signal transduction histidine kinase/ActR/RegA family two-component response regulator
MTEAPESQKQRLYRLAFEDSRDATIVFDAGGRVLLLNRAARELPEELVERLVEGGGPRAAELAKFRDELKAGGRAHVEVAITGRVLALDGRTHGDQHVVSLRDVTERRRLDSELRSLQRAESIGHLTASVVHDFNNLLTPIACLSAQLEKELNRESRPSEMARDIRSAAERAAGLARQVLSFARRQPARMERLNVGAVVMELRDMLQRVVGANVDVELALDPAAGDVLADRERLEHVLLQLAASARDSMAAGGRFTVSSARVSFEEADSEGPEGAGPGAYLLLTVSDTGGGLTPELREKMFERFFSNADARDEVGRSSGLTSARRFVAESRGCIRFHAEPGRGTTLALYLPRLEAEERTPSSSMKASETRGTRSETILVVDDVDGVRNAVRAVLEDRGYTVLVAASGEEALETARTHSGPIQLAIVDVIMPHMTGPELARMLRVLRPMRVLLTSGHTDRVLERNGVRVGDFSLLRKAFSPSELVKKVREVLDADPAAFERSCG